MAPSLQRPFENLERRKAALLSDVSTWSPARLRFRPDANSWSTLDVLDHLVKVENMVLNQIRTNLPNGHRAGLKDGIAGWFVIGVMLTPVRVKVPVGARDVVPQIDAAPALIAERWSKARIEITDLLKRLSPSQIGRGLMKHPISGWMSLPLALTFLDSHLKHHCYQLSRLKHASRGL